MSNFKKNHLKIDDKKNSLNCPALLIPLCLIWMLKYSEQESAERAHEVRRDRRQHGDVQRHRPPAGYPIFCAGICLLTHTHSHFFFSPRGFCARKIACSASWGEIARVCKRKRECASFPLKWENFGCERRCFSPSQIAQTTFIASLNWNFKWEFFHILLIDTKGLFIYLFIGSCVHEKFEGYWTTVFTYFKLNKIMLFDTSINF